MARQIYFGDWEKYRDMVADFDGSYEAKYEDKTPCVVGMPPASAVLFACYTYENYSGSAFVLFELGGKLYEVNGGHCSCYGLEGQWQPEETSWKALAMREWRYRVDDPKGEQVLSRLINRHLKEIN